MQKQPLRYKISNWRQLPGAMSNNSNKLKLSTTDFIQNDRLRGLRVQLEHQDFGILFACVLGAEGDIVNEHYENMVVEFTPLQIITELEKYGIYITYQPDKKLPAKQLVYLENLRRLNFDKLRILYVHKYVNGIKEVKWYLAAFRVQENPQWINNWYSPSEKEFHAAMMNGSAMNLSKVSRSEGFNWDWLVDYVANIDDIMEAHG